MAMVENCLVTCGGNGQSWGVGKSRLTTTAIKSFLCRCHFILLTIDATMALLIDLGAETGYWAPEEFDHL